MRRLLVLLLLLTGCKCASVESERWHGSSVIGEHPVDLSVPQLESETGGATLRIPLETGAPPASLTRTRIVPHGPGGYSWVGKLDGPGRSVITVHDGQVFGTIRRDQDVYRVTAGPDGKLRIARFVPPKTGPDVPASSLHGPAPDFELEDGPIDVLVGYTRAAASLAECQPIRAMIVNAIQQANDIAAASGLVTRFELVETYESHIDQSQYSLSGLVDAFARDDEQARHRDASGADIAVLVAASDHSVYDGISMRTMADKDTAFSVVACDTAALEYSLAHEIGHLLGLNDDWDRDDAVTFKDGFGYVHDSADPSHSWRTVMATPRTCTHAPPCPRIPYWSNPDVTYQGDATGDTTRNNDAQVIRRTAGAVQHFRAPTH
jgi:hypothetical protein